MLGLLDHLRRARLSLVVCTENSGSEYFLGVDASHPKRPLRRGIGCWRLRDARSEGTDLLAMHQRSQVWILAEIKGVWRARLYAPAMYCSRPPVAKSVAFCRERRVDAIAGAHQVGT